MLNTYHSADGRRQGLVLKGSKVDFLYTVVVCFYVQQRKGEEVIWVSPFHVYVLVTSGERDTSGLSVSEVTELWFSTWRGMKAIVLLDPNKPS